MRKQTFFNDMANHYKSFSLYKDRVLQDNLILYFFIFLSTVVSFCILYFRAPEITNDSYSYIEAANLLGSGIPDLQRTPAYPLFIKICETIFGNKYMLISVCVLQTLIALFSIKYFYRLAHRFILNRYIIYAITFLYSVHPSILMYHGAVLTESLSISLMVFLFYLLLKSADKPDILTLLLSGVLVLVLLMLRSASLYLLPLLFLYYGYLFITKRKKIYIIGILSMIIISLFELGYCNHYKSHHGIFSPGYIGLLNNYYNLRSSGLIDHSVIDYSGDVVNYNILSDNMPDNATYYDEFFFLINNYSLSDISLSVKQTIQNNKKDVIKGIFYRFYKSSFSRVGAWYYPSDNLYQKILYTLFFKLPLLLGVFYILLFLYMIRLIRLYIKTRTPDINAALIWSCIVSNIIVMIVGAQGEWDRLILPVLPFIYILTGNYLENFRYPFKLK